MTEGISPQAIGKGKQNLDNAQALGTPHYDVTAMVVEGRLSLDDIITHRVPAADAVSAYETAFGDPTCVKMILNWSHPV